MTTEGRTPPSSVEAESSALGSVLIRPAALDELLTALTPSDFTLAAHREIFEAFQSLDQRRQAIDVVTVADELKRRGTVGKLDGGEAYLIALASGVPTHENVGHYVRIVAQKAQLRRVIAACTEVAARAYGDCGDHDAFMGDAETAMFKAVQQGRSETYHATSEIVGEVMSAIETRAQEQREVTGVPTGFTNFDRLTAGLQPGNLIIVAARPGVGKTTWAVNSAMHAAGEHGIPALIFSLEMSRNELVERMLSAESRIDGARLRRGRVEYDEWKTSLYPAGRAVGGAPVVIDDTSTGILELRAQARRWRADQKCFPAGQQMGLIVVDYLQLARGTNRGKGGSREQEIAEIARALKQLAKDLKVPVIAVSQLNRGVENREDKRPKLSDLRESGAIEQDADLVVFVHRDDYYDPSNAEAGKADLILSKNRHGACGETPMTFLKEITRFENFAHEAPEYA